MLADDGEEQPPPTTTTTTSTTTTTTASTTAPPDPVEELADAYADRLADELGLAPGPAELECLSRETLRVIGPHELTELGEDPVVPTLSSEDHEALVRAVVTCLGPLVAAALLGEQTTTIVPPAVLPDEGSE